MCLNPTTLPHGQVPCRNCWQCRYNRVNDLVGRCIAEKNTSTQTCAITLTYGEGDKNPSAFLLTYRDFQNFMKKLRIEGFKVRYIVCGEYGTKKGRAHWHAILFFNGPMPKWAYNQNTNIEKYWPHGHAFIENPSYAAFKYVLKYTLKDAGEGIKAHHLAMSKKPPLGDAFLRQLASQYVDQGLAPQDLKYQIAGEKSRAGKVREFYLSGKSRENFLDYFIEEWLHRYPTKDLPWSEIVEDRQDEHVRDAIWADEREHLDSVIRKYAQNCHWSNRPDMTRTIVKVVSAAKAGQVVSKNIDGLYQLHCYHTEGWERWRVNLGSRGALRQALRGLIDPPQHKSQDKSAAAGPRRRVSLPN